jgi:hypothetical protein
MAEQPEQSKNFMNQFTFLSSQGERYFYLLHKKPGGFIQQQKLAVLPLGDKRKSSATHTKVFLVLKIVCAKVTNFKGKKYSDIIIFEQ